MDLHHRRPRHVTVLLAAALLAVGALACQPQAPEERVAELRSEYEAELRSFSVRETPMLEESGMAMEEGGEMAADGDEAGTATVGGEGEAAGEGAGEGIVEEVPVQQDVLLDVILHKRGSTDRLPGLTLDVYQQGADGNEKATYRFYVDTSSLNKGSQSAVSYVLEDVDFEEGDGFAVEVRSVVPPELYSEYKEFNDAVAEGGGE